LPSTTAAVSVQLIAAAAAAAAAAAVQGTAVYWCPCAQPAPCPLLLAAAVVEHNVLLLLPLLLQVLQLCWSLCACVAP
jgi:hypothetical protein